MPPSSASWTSTAVTDPDRAPMAANAGDCSPIHSSSSTASRGALIKGKRTKRRRMLNLRELSPTPPPPATPPPALPTAAAAANAETTNNNNNNTVSPASSSSAAVAYGSSSACQEVGGGMDEEDEDLALCLILLAQGRTDPSGGASRGPPVDPVGDASSPLAEMQVLAAASTERVRKRRRRPSVLLAATSAAAATGVYDGVYECRTCNKRFSSFQALGGHRTSHTKPKVLLPAGPGSPTHPTALEDGGHAPRPAPSVVQLAAAGVPDNVSTSSSPSLTAATPIPSRATRHPRAHECSICGAEFSSGQALGGHMRRHRPLTATGATTPAESTSASGIEEIDTAGQHQNRSHDDNNNNNNIEASAATHAGAIISLDLNLPAPFGDYHSHNNKVVDAPPMGMGSAAAASSGRFPLVAGKPPGAAVFGSSSPATAALVDCLPLLT